MCYEGMPPRPQTHYPVEESAGPDKFQELMEAVDNVVRNRDNGFLLRTAVIKLGKAKDEYDNTVSPGSR